jgi:hypothetical protein
VGNERAESLWFGFRGGGEVVAVALDFEAAAAKAVRLCFIAFHSSDPGDVVNRLFLGNGGGKLACT